MMILYGVHVIGYNKILALEWSEKDAKRKAKHIANTYYPGRLTEDDFGIQKFYVSFPPQVDESEPLNLAVVREWKLESVHDKTTA